MNFSLKSKLGEITHNDEGTVDWSLRIIRKWSRAGIYDRWPSKCRAFEDSELVLILGLVTSLLLVYLGTFSLVWNSVQKSALPGLTW